MTDVPYIKIYAPRRKNGEPGQVIIIKIVDGLFVIEQGVGGIPAKENISKEKTTYEQ